MSLSSKVEPKQVRPQRGLLKSGRNKKMGYAGWEQREPVTVRVRKLGGRQPDEQKRMRMRLSVGEGRREGTSVLLSHTRPVPTVDPANPCLNWGRIPVHMLPWNERRERKTAASDTSDRQQQRLGWCTVCECTLLEYKHAARLSAHLKHKWLRVLRLFVFIQSNMKRALRNHITLLTHVLLHQRCV